MHAYMHTHVCMYVCMYAARTQRRRYAKTLANELKRNEGKLACMRAVCDARRTEEERLVAAEPRARPVRQPAV